MTRTVTATDGPAAPPLDALLQRVELGDEGDPGQAILVEAMRRLLCAPTAQAAARDFLAEAVPARILFGPMDAKGLALWSEGAVRVTINEGYLRGDFAPEGPSLPVVLCHELLGHGVWHARGARQNAWQAIHHHELNEVYALLLGWIVEMELGGGAPGPGALSYLADPEGYVANMKLRTTYYALTFSSAAMRRPMETIAARIEWMEAQKVELERGLANHRSWAPAADALVRWGRVPEHQVTAVRRDLADQDAALQNDLRSIDLGLGELRATLERMRSEADRQSERYLVWAADCPAVLTLTQETQALEQRLRTLLSTAPSLEDGPPPVAPDDGQLTFDQLAELYRQDRAEYPQRWRGAVLGVLGPQEGR